jgi:hypothetical protein
VVLSYKFNDLLRDAISHLPNYMITDQHVVRICRANNCRCQGEKRRRGTQRTSRHAPVSIRIISVYKLNRGSREHLTSIYLLRLQLAASSAEEGCLEELGEAAAAVGAGNQSLRLAEAEEAVGVDLAQQ